VADSLRQRPKRQAAKLPKQKSKTGFSQIKKRTRPRFVRWAGSLLLSQSVKICGNKNSSKKRFNNYRKRNTGREAAFLLKNNLTMKKTIVCSVAILAVTALLFSSFSKKTGQPLVKGDANFKDFLKQFPNQNLPYELDAKTLQARLEAEVARYNDQTGDYVMPERKRLSWEYYKFLPDLKEASRFSRNPLIAEPIVAFQTDQHHAVIYLATRGYARNYGTYFVSVFDKKGKHVATNEAGSVYPITLISFSLDKNLQATATSWQVNWEKDYDEHGLEGNKIAGLTLLETRSFDAMKLPQIENEEEETPPTESTEETVNGASD
jgi:hypothetical protein